jgi:hypothetical protein
LALRFIREEVGIVQDFHPTMKKELFAFLVHSLLPKKDKKLRIYLPERERERDRETEREGQS